MALITNNISGSISDSWRIGITGSVKFGNPGGDNNQLHIPDFPGTDVSFFVSGSRGGKGGVNRTVAVFGGDAVISGSLTVGTGSITITSNEIQFGNGAARIFSGSGGLTFVDSSGGTKTLASLSTGGGGSGTNYWGEAALNKIYSTGSVAIGTATSADSQGTDVFFFVSGSQDGSSSSLFGGNLILSGNLLAKDSGGLTTINLGKSTGLISGSGNLQAGGTLTVAGNSTLGGTLLVAGTSTLAAVTATTVSGSGNFQVGGNITLQGDLDSDANESKTLFGTVGAGSTITVGGASSTVRIPGNLTVQGTTTTIDTNQLVIEDPLIYFASGSITSNQNGGIAIASGSSVTDQALVWGRVANDTWGAGRKDVNGGSTADLTTGVVLLPVRASKFEVGGTNASVTSSNGNVLSLLASTDVILNAGSGGGPGDLTFQIGSPGSNTVLLVSGSSPNITDIKAGPGRTILNLANTTATTVNFAGAGTDISVGSGTGNLYLKNATTNVSGALVVAGVINANNGTITTSQTAFNFVNATATTVNFAGAGTDISVGASTGNLYLKNAATNISGSLTVVQTANLNGAVNLGDTSGDTVTVNGTTTFIGSTVTTTLQGSGSISGNLTVGGTTSLNGIVNLGNATGDDISFIGLVSTNLLPKGDKSQDLGGPSNRWANIYTGDLHLRNERGNWTIIEESDFLTITNNLNGKRYKFVMEEI